MTQRPSQPARSEGAVSRTTGRRRGCSKKWVEELRVAETFVLKKNSHFGFRAKRNEDCVRRRTKRCVRETEDLASGLLICVISCRVVSCRIVCPSHETDKPDSSTHAKVLSALRGNAFEPHLFSECVSHTNPEHRQNRVLSLITQQLRLSCIYLSMLIRIFSRRRG